MKKYWKPYFQNMPHWNDSLGCYTVTCPYCGQEVVQQGEGKETICENCLTKIAVAD